MEDWKEKLVNAVSPLLEPEGACGIFSRLPPRRVTLRHWLRRRGLGRVRDITSPAHVVELMELIDRWHDEDAAKQPCAAPAQPANPFIIERVEREIKRGTIDDITIKGFNFQFVNIAIEHGPFTPKDLRTLAKHLTDLADAHETIYPPNQCAAAC